MRISTSNHNTSALTVSTPYGASALTSVPGDPSVKHSTAVMLPSAPPQLNSPLIEHNAPPLFAAPHALPPLSAEDGLELAHL